MKDSVLFEIQFDWNVRKCTAILVKKSLERILGTNIDRNFCFVIEKEKSYFLLASQIVLFSRWLFFYEVS